MHCPLVWFKRKHDAYMVDNVSFFLSQKQLLIPFQINLKGDESLFS